MYGRRRQARTVYRMQNAVLGAFAAVTKGSRIRKGKNKGDLCVKAGLYLGA